MSALTFDTFKFVDRLEKAGFARDQAAAMVEAQRDAFATAIDNSLATKDDIRLVRDEVRDVRKDIDKLVWMMGILIAIAVANFGKQFF